MAFEIERKFLVLNTSFIDEARERYSIKQGFLNSHKQRTVRVRIVEDKGLLTVKGESSKDGLVRFEWEKELSLSEAEDLITLCEPGLIEKTRYIVPVEGHIFEIDVFEGQNKGLIIAELELANKDDDFKSPDWLGEEVTGNIRYYNSQLAKKPFKHW